MPNAFHYAVVVGVNEYPAISPLNSPGRDAEAFQKWLLSAEGGDVPPANIKTVATPPGVHFPDRHAAVPTRKEVNRALSEVMDAFEKEYEKDANAWDNSRLYLYVSGHGIAPDASEAALLMANATREEYGESIGCALYLKRFRDSTQFREIVFFADCCRSEAENADPGGPPWNRRKYQRGTVVPLLGFAAEFQSLAFEPPADDTGRSYFTKALIEALEGSAARVEANGTSVIDSHSVKTYMDWRVPQLTKAVNRQQEPRINDFGGPPIVFRRFTDTRPKRQVKIAFPAGFTGQVTINVGDATNKQVVAHDAALGPLTISLPDGLYVARQTPGGNGQRFVNGGAFEVSPEGTNVQL